MANIVALIQNIINKFHFIADYITKGINLYWIVVPEAIIGFITFLILPFLGIRLTKRGKADFIDLVASLIFIIGLLGLTK